MCQAYRNTTTTTLCNTASESCTTPGGPLDATTLGALLVGAGGMISAVVAYVGKRGENAVMAYSSLTNDLQEERDALRLQVAELHALRAADQAEITRLRIELARLGGQP